MSFNPNQERLADAVARITKIQTERGHSHKGIITSRTFGDVWKDRDLHVGNVPGGFNKVLLPFFFESGSTFYISSAGPNVVVPRHSHDEGPGVRFIASGSIIYDNHELAEGGWMYIPAGLPYEFTVGPRGTTMFYCYCCSCAGARPGEDRGGPVER